MASISHSVITGGNFTSYEHGHIYVGGNKTGFDRLQEAVAPGAFHNSGVRFDPPKCHPNTRVAVTKKIMNWILRLDPEMRKAFILWLHGAAGAGKSAIAQDIAELCHSQGRLLASFFFSRSDAHRNNARALFATIAYQMALVLPQVQERLDATIGGDQLIFTRSLPAQFQSLIVEPLIDLVTSGFFNDPNAPRLVIIDGLDECTDRQIQCMILDVIFRSVQEHRLPLMFLVASRPEHDISSRFNICSDKNVPLFRLLLDHSYLPDRDIELFLRESFKGIRQTHPFRRSIPSSWPTEEVIKYLIQKSSGQFIYASTVVKYTKSSRHRPHQRLNDVLSLRAVGRDHPFAQLDALYTHIFSSVDHIEQVLHVLSFHLLSDAWGYVEEIKRILSLEEGEIEVLFCDLTSLVRINEMFGKEKLHVLHASLPDFLLDESRSGRFYISFESDRTVFLQKCLSFLRDEPFNDPTLSGTHRLAMNFFRHKCNNYLVSAGLLHSVSSFSVARVHEEVSSSLPMSQSVVRLMQDFNYKFLPSFFHFLKRLQSESAEFPYEYHLRDFERLLQQHLEVYYADMSLTFFVALTSFASSRNDDTWLPALMVFDVDSRLRRIDDTRLALIPLHQSNARDYCRLIYNYLKDLARSGPYGLTGEKYATAALCCLYYLRDNQSDTESIHPQLSRRQSSIRRFQSPGDIEIDHTYYFWLEYLAFFLNRSDDSEALIELCRQDVFSPRAQGYPHQYKEARRAISEYLARVDSKTYVRYNF